MTAATVTVIGGGIVGLATARELAAAGHAVTVLEKESGWARHQTGHNSGVIHAGPYYKPGSLKAALCAAGNASMSAFAEQQGIPHAICGKLIVATSAEELPRLEELHRRAVANGAPARLIGPDEARDYEPHVAGVAALRVESTGIIDYSLVAARLAELAAADGARLVTGAEVDAIRVDATGVTVGFGGDEVRSDALVNCAGLHSDRIARLAGLRPRTRIVPFRGEYYELIPERRDLVRGLIYPVPDPSFPFLGVHLTRMIDGSVHAGPNAVLALRREGYRWREISLRDTAESVLYPGFIRLASRNVATGAAEILRSISRSRFATGLARLVPEIGAKDLMPAGAGVRAQAISRDGSLVDDFAIERGPRQIHVLNAPSPAATASLEIGRHIAALVADAV